MKKLYTGNGNPPPDKPKNPKRDPIQPFDDGGGETQTPDDTGNGNPPPDKP